MKHKPRSTAEMIWHSIRRKAHLFKTANWQGQPVKILEVTNSALGIFRIETFGGTRHHVGCEHLDHYSL